MITDTTVIIANYLHPHFTKQCVESVRKYYPDIPIIVVDDCSPHSSYPDPKLDTQYAYFVDFGEENISEITLKYHMGHGIALDYGVEQAKTKYVITMDHDTGLIKENVFEFLFSFMTNEYIYGVGRVKVNSTPFHFLSPDLALWRVDLIKQYKLSFSEVTMEDENGKAIHFATAQLLCARLQNVYGYEFNGHSNKEFEEYIVRIGFAKYPTTQHDYKIKREKI